MTRKELLYLLILLPERAKSKDDLSGADDDMHTPQTELTERAAARRAHLMGVTREFRLLPGTALCSQSSFHEAVVQKMVPAGNR